MMTKSDYLKARYELSKYIRNFFDKRSYIEVDTPVLVRAPGTEVHLDYFESNWLDIHSKSHKMFLRSSPELHLKQVLSSGIDRVFHLAKCFRNHGELSSWHHPEFMMLEWYEVGCGYEAFMDMTEELIRGAFSLFAKRELGPVERISVFEAFREFVGIELIDQDADLAKKARAIGNISCREDDDFETAFFKLMLDYVEPALCKKSACILYDYPASQAALAKVEKNRAKRFEFYIDGIELSNAFFELTSYEENKSRIEESQIKRAELHKQEVFIDKEFLTAIKSGIPDCSGNALGFDRLLALCLGLPGIKDVVPFSSMEPYSIET